MNPISAKGVLVAVSAWKILWAIDILVRQAEHIPAEVNECISVVYGNVLLAYAAFYKIPKPPPKRQKSIALAKSESMVPNMQNLISRPMGTLFLVSDAPQTSISRKTDLSSIIEVFPEFQLDQKGGKIQNPLCRPPHFFAMLGVRTNPRPLLLYKWGAFL